MAPLLLMAPPYAIMLLRDRLYRYYFQLTFSRATAVLLLNLTFGFSFVAVGLIFMALYLTALGKVSGQRYIVGHVYDRRGLAESITLQLGEYSYVGEVEDGGERWHLYIVWKTMGETRVADYALLSPEKLEDALSSASQWGIESTGGLFVTGQVYPVTLLRAEASAVDVFREEAGLDPSVPIYYLRDYPGRIAKHVQSEARKVIAEVIKGGRKGEKGGD